MRIALVAATAFSVVPMIAMAQEPAKDEATVVGGRFRVINSIMNSEDESKPEKYQFKLDRARLSLSRTVKGVEAAAQFRLESDQNGRGNEDSTDPSLSTTSIINRAYINFKDVVPGLNVQVGKQIYKFADDADYGIAATDAQLAFGTVNGGYGVGLFTDYKIPGDMGTAHIALTNGNGKTNEDNNSQKAFVSHFRLAPVKGVGVNFGYAANTLKKDADKNVSDTNITVGATTSQDLTFVSLGFEYDLRTTKRDGKYYGSTSGNGIAARAGYKLDALNLIGVYNMLQKTYETEQGTGYAGGTLDSKTKTPKASTLVAAAEYTIGSAIVGGQYKMKTNDAKIFKDKDGKVAEKSAADVTLYTQINF